MSVCADLNLSPGPKGHVAHEALAASSGFGRGAPASLTHYLHTGTHCFQKSHWQKIRTMVNLPVMSPFRKRYSWVQLAGHTGEQGCCGQA